MYPFANNIPETDRITELDTQIAELKQKIAQKKAAALQSKYDRMNDPDYRVARYDYIVSGDRSGLDRISEAERAYKNMLVNQAYAKELAEAQRLDSQLYQMDEHMKNRSIAATKAQYADSEYKKALNSGDTDAINLATKNRDLANAELAYWNKRVGYTETAKKNDDDEAAAKGKSIDDALAKTLNKTAKNSTQDELKSYIESLSSFNRSDVTKAREALKEELKKREAADAYTAKINADINSFKKNGRLTDNLQKAGYKAEAINSLHVIQLKKDNKVIATFNTATPSNPASDNSPFNWR